MKEGEPTPAAEKLQPTRVFVELGPSRIPVPAIGERAFNEKNVYIGIDRNREALAEGREEMDRGNPNVHFLAGDVRELPVRDGTADEVFLGNILGDPGITLQRKLQFMNEAKRILKPGGTIIVKETHTPIRLQEFDDIVRQHGFALMKGVPEESEKWAEAIKPYETAAARSDPSRMRSQWPAFIAFLKPIEDQ